MDDATKCKSGNILIKLTPMIHKQISMYQHWCCQRVYVLWNVCLYLIMSTLICITGHRQSTAVLTIKSIPIVKWCVCMCSANWVCWAYSEWNLITEVFDPCHAGENMKSKYAGVFITRRNYSTMNKGTFMWLIMCIWVMCLPRSSQYIFTCF